PIRLGPTLHHPIVQKASPLKFNFLQLIDFYKLSEGTSKYLFAMRFLEQPRMAYQAMECSSSSLKQ
ncbi:hypothetical protein H5410_052918, partial [Solanum commersonii]